jgi:hypothetical protein
MDELTPIFTAADRKYKRRPDFREKQSEQLTEAQTQAENGFGTLDTEAAQQLRDWELP